MIIPFQNTFAVPALDLVPAFFNSLGTIQQAVKDYKDKDYGIKKLQSGGRGRQMLLAYDSLPGHIKAAIGDPRKIENPLQTRYVNSSEAVRYFTNYEDEHGYLSLPLIEEYISNANVLIATLQLEKDRISEWRSKGKVSNKGLEESLLKDVIHFNGLLVGLKEKETITHTLPGSLKRFRELYRAFRKPDNEWSYTFRKLITGKRGNKNTQKVDDKTLRLLNDMFATTRHKPTRTEVARMYCSFLDGYKDIVDSDGVMYDPKEFKQLSYNTITGYLKKWEQRLSSEKFRTGDKERFLEKNVPYFSLEKPTYAGSLISIDDRQPPFKFNKAGDRVWFYLAYDPASDTIVSYVYGQSKEGIIRAFYQQLIADHWEQGWEMPHQVECEANLNSTYKNDGLREGTVFKHVRMTGNDPRTKIIERNYNRRVRYEIEKKEDGWIPRPHARSEANQTGIYKEQIIPYENIVKMAIKHIEDFNNKPHPKNQNITCWEYACTNRIAKPNEWNWRALLATQWADVETSSCNVGLIKFRSTEFVLAKDGAIALGEDLINLMNKVDGRTFNIHYLLGNDEEVIKAHVYMNDTFQCEIIKKPKPNRALAEWTADDRTKYDAFRKYQQTIAEHQEIQVNKVEPVMVIDNGTAPQLAKKYFAKELHSSIPIKIGTQVEIVPDRTADTDSETETKATYTISLKNTF